MKHVLTIVAVVAVAGCDAFGTGSDPTMSGTAAVAVIERIFQANLSPDTGEHKVLSRSIMTTVIQGRFETSETDLHQLLKDSKLLADTLEHENPFDRDTGAIVSWWEPSKLTNAKGLKCDWQDGLSLASCRLALGTLPGHAQPTVFFMVIFENMHQTGGEPTVKADPAWTGKNEKLQQGGEGHR